MFRGMTQIVIGGLNQGYEKVTRSASVKVGAGLTVLGGSVANAAPTDFASALPTSLLPDGFWGLVALVLGAVVTVGGVILGIGLIKRSRN
jgi:hypothetical protein